MLDPVRAAVGAWMFLQGIVPLSERIGLGASGDAILMGAVFGIGIVVQTLARRDEDYVFSPFGYTAGVVMFFCGPIVAVPAIILGIGSAVAMRVWTPFFFGIAVICLILGPVTNQNAWPTQIATGMACLLPPLVSVMAGRHMGFPRR
ncbi:MAG: hypothetical protein ABII82_04115 [Verrucomicrobiota bacterium]